jgi:endonuclease YncB( thermonuclease family)
MATLAVTSWDAQMPALRLRRRRWRNRAAAAILLCIAGSIVVDHLLASGHGDDWSQFDGRQVLVISADDAQTISVRGGDGDHITQVRVLGIGSTDDFFAEKSREFLASSLTGRLVTLKLEPTQTRDPQGRLLASVFLEDDRPISVDVVDRGLDRADRRQPYAFFVEVQRAQSDARKKGRGLWIGY